MIEVCHKRREKIKKVARTTAEQLIETVEILGVGINFCTLTFRCRHCKKTSGEAHRLLLDTYGD